MSKKLSKGYQRKLNSFSEQRTSITRQYDGHLVHTALTNRSASLQVSAQQCNVAVDVVLTANSVDCGFEYRWLHYPNTLLFKTNLWLICKSMMRCISRHRGDVHVERNGDVQAIEPRSTEHSNKFPNQM